MQDASKVTLYESPLMHYLAVQGIDAHAKALRSAFTYTPILGRMLWIIRLVMLEIAVPLVPWGAIGLKSKAKIPSIPDRIHALRSKHLCEGSYSPAASILSQLAMGKSYNKTHQSPANIHWSNDEQTIHYQGQPVELSKIQAMGDVLSNELQDLLQELAFGAPVPFIDLGNIVDSMAWSQEFRRTEYSFINHTHNKARTDVGYEFLLKRAQKGSPEWRMFKKTVNGPYQWNEGQKRAYLTRERQFLRKAMVVIHVTYGQPARGPEVGSGKVSNSIYSARNWYVINGRMCFLSMYDKARKRRGNTDYIIRVLPDKVSQIMAQYMAYVRPFARVLDRRESEYLFADERGPWAGEELSRELAKATSKHLGVRLTVQAWRHTAIGIAVRKLERASRTWEKDEEDNDIEEFAEGDDKEELELNTFRHVMIR
jgi:hypothetical protein